MRATHNGDQTKTLRPPLKPLSVWNLKTNPTRRSCLNKSSLERPSDTELEIEAEVSREIDHRPQADAYARVAQRRRMSRDEVEQAVFNVGEYRNPLADDVRREAGHGVVGRVEGDVNVIRTDLGAMTAILSVAVIGRPDRGLPDQDLDHLAQAALRRVVQNLSTLDMDAIRASLWYEGIGCPRHSMGYGASWQRESGRFTLR